MTRLVTSIEILPLRPGLSLVLRLYQCQKPLFFVNQKKCCKICLKAYKTYFAILLLVYKKYRFDIGDTSIPALIWKYWGWEDIGPWSICLLFWLEMAPFSKRKLESKFFFIYDFLTNDYVPSNCQYFENNFLPIPLEMNDFMHFF